MSPFCTSMSTSTMANSAPLSMLNPAAPNNSSSITAVTPHQPNAPSLTPSPLKGIASVTTLMTSTRRPPASLKPSRGYPISLIQKQLFRGLHQPNPPHLPQNTLHLSLIFTYYPGHSIRTYSRDSLGFSVAPIPSVHVTK